MKLNFWQWLGVVLLLIGLGMFAYKRMKTTGDATPGTGGPAASPSSPHSAP